MKTGHTNRTTLTPRGEIVALILMGLAIGFVLGVCAVIGTR